MSSAKDLLFPLLQIAYTCIQLPPFRGLPLQTPPLIFLRHSRHSAQILNKQLLQKFFSNFSQNLSDWTWHSTLIKSITKYSVFIKHNIAHISFLQWLYCSQKNTKAYYVNTSLILELLAQHDPKHCCLWSPGVLPYHRMLWVGSDLKDHPVTSPCHGQGHLPADQDAQSPIPAALLKGHMKQRTPQTAYDKAFQIPPWATFVSLPHLIILPCFTKTGLSTQEILCLVLHQEALLLRSAFNWHHGHPGEQATPVSALLSATIPASE